MSRIPLTPGDKDRISANAGRLLAAMLPGAGLSGMSPELVYHAVDRAIDIERALIAALCPTDIEGD